MRLIGSIFLLTIAPAVVAAGPACERFEPSVVEVEQLQADAGSVIPREADFEYACQISTLELVTPTSLRESFQKNYHFLWLTHRLEHLRFYRKGICQKVEDAAVRCREHGSMVQVGQSRPFEYSTDIGDVELQELIVFLQDVFPSDVRIAEIFLFKEHTAEGHEVGNRTFGIEISGGEEIARIIIEKQCSESNHCKHSLSPHSWFRANTNLYNKALKPFATLTRTRLRRAA